MHICIHMYVSKYIRRAVALVEWKMNKKLSSKVTRTIFVFVIVVYLAMGFQHLMHL